MLKKITLLALASLLSVSVVAQRPATALPDVSALARFTMSDQSKEKLEMGIGEVEFAVQGYIYPNIKANLFLAFHEEEGGEERAEMEEAYVTVETLDAYGFNGMSADIGRRRTPFGKYNQTHFERLPFLDRPLVHQEFLGFEGLIGNGVLVAQLLPLPFFSQVEVGFWSTVEHNHSATSNTHNTIENNFASMRWWNSLTIGDTELQAGTSFLTNIPEDDTQEQNNIVGIDLTWTVDNLLVQGEWMSASLQHEHGGSGGFIFTNYSFDRFHHLGLRYDRVDHEDEEKNTVSLIGQKFITETSYWSAQFDYDLDEYTTKATVALTIGLGPHSHILN